MVAELIEPPDAEAAVIAHVAAGLATQWGFEAVEVLGALSTRTADYTPPVESVVVRRTGGSERDLIVDDAQVTLTAWAERPGDEERASAIARRAHAIVCAAERVGFMGDVACSQVRALSTPYADPDPVTARARYSATYVVALRGQVL